MKKASLTLSFKRRLIISLVVVSFVIWILINQPGKFGIHVFGFTVYSGIPLPYVDVKVHANGWPSLRKKSHFLAYEEIKDLLEEKPEVIVIGIGYSNAVRVDERILKIKGPRIEILSTPEAISRFNELKTKGVKVAAIIHSTC
ncbi:MAG TPA: hypothetical protein EYP68_02950 [Candidatus Korarchaeota archaeon]|nr:hypothetical protein [Candidatus Korarchaeota archaeon]